MDNSFQSGVARTCFSPSARRAKRKDDHKIDVLILDNGGGGFCRARAVTAFGGSLCYDNRETVGKYGMGMKAAALSMGPVLEIYSWQEPGAIYRMILDTVDLSNKNTNVVQLLEPVLVNLPRRRCRDLIQPMGYPKNTTEQSWSTTGPSAPSVRLTRWKRRRTQHRGDRREAKPVGPVVDNSDSCRTGQPRPPGASPVSVCFLTFQSDDLRYKIIRLLQVSIVARVFSRGATSIV